MTYPETIRYLESFINYEKVPAYPYKKSLKLERIKDFLNTIGNPQASLRCIHIAGTKGKGSTCAFIAYILKEAGYKVGLYTSPHLSDFRERIRILKPKADSRRLTAEEDFEGMISKKDLSRLVAKLKPEIESYNKKSVYGPLTFFEVYTSLAFVYFKLAKVDFVVLETGLGGRLDATNVVNPLVCVIAPISYEHTQKLGNTLREIATEKAGIIKSSQLSALSSQPVVISAPQKKEALEVIKEKCKKTGSRLYLVGRDIKYNNCRLSAFGYQLSAFSVQGRYGNYRNLKIRLLGAHQLVNASMALGVIEALRNYGIIIKSEVIRGGLHRTRWPGRCEVIARNPLVILDGAQNIASASVIKEAIKKNFTYQKLILVLGISNDKDISGICRVLKPLADVIILTQARNPRAGGVDMLESAMKEQGPKAKAKVIKNKDVIAAVGQAREIASKGDLILITGSLFVVGKARTYYA